MGKEIPYDNAQIGIVPYFYSFEENSTHSETISLGPGCIFHMQRGCK